ncbi:uncharacterized protein [Haliotis cracherodii]|uniref:uncharacterized protein n=1 Tax=Haliotis cracherodii TaxID=6455 RepID=UPI0039E91DEC
MKRNCLEECFILVLFVLNVHGVFHSCVDVKQQTGNATDGEYILYLQQNIGASLYCAGMKTNSPKEYLTLKAGRSNNFAVYSKDKGSDSCGSMSPAQVYSQWGRTEFTKIRLHVDTFNVDITDYTFTKQIGPNHICYGCAGDSFSSSLNCTPHGNFKIDLSETPFAISPDIQWTWNGQYSKPGQAQGQAFIANYTYIGCFIDGRVRLLPSAYMTSSSMTPDVCISHCKQKGYRYAGVEYTNQCFCGDSHTRYALASKETECNSKCQGDFAQTCGGAYRISVYATAQDQITQGSCGGMPGSCFPALKSSLTLKGLKLALVSKHPCLNGVCRNEASCVAVSELGFKCICQKGYVGPLCDQLQSFINVDGSDCPAAMQPEQCSCSSTCSGARFEADSCTTSSGKPQVTCRYGDPGFVLLYNQAPTGTSKQTAICPVGSDIVGCSVWDNNHHSHGQGAGTMDVANRKCSISGCGSCTVQARCKQYMCGCLNGGTCSRVTGTCSCPAAYFGDHCELFDYCSYYEDHNNRTACGAGTCLAVPEQSVHTYGGDNAGDHCLFPFTYTGLTFSSCINSNQVGPPFACGAKFDGNNDYIDLGQWNPGTVYTISAWLYPTISDSRRRTIVGGVAGCRDFGLAMQGGKFNSYYYPTTGRRCTASLFAPTPYTKGKWYLLAVANNGTNTFFYLNGKQVNTAKNRPYSLPTTSGFRIGSSQCCKGENFQGMIKSVKVWKRSLDIDEITQSMSVVGSVNSTIEARYNGLVAHYELGQGIKVPCNGIDHGGDDWTVAQNDILFGSHCNVSQFFIPKGVTVFIKKYDGTSGGIFEVYSESIQIDGYLNGMGAGYRGAAGGAAYPNQDGMQGESINGVGKRGTGANKGGGGGGSGGHIDSQGYGRPGAGGGYGTAGMSSVKRSNRGSGWSSGGAVYGDNAVSTVYMGSGGGSGGNAKDLSHTPPGGHGGNGGAAIVLYSTGNIQVTGSISVAGEAGQGDSFTQSGCNGCPASCKASNPSHCIGSSTSACWDMSGPGGGGSGGSMYMTGNVVDVGHNRLWANGGQGGYGGVGGCGGDGGVGRIQINAVIFKGHVSSAYGHINTNNATKQYIDYSITGQKMIDPTTTVIGNEVYRGCFLDSKTSRHFVYRVSLSQQQTAQVTPDFCMAMCRQKGYTVSGVEYGSECYCDNNFNWGLKKPDSDCGMPCKGDPQQYCGASYRLAVYGPRPYIPGEGQNGVASSCQPWCATADAFSSQPKWGVCDLSSLTSTSWNVHCECPAGFTGSNCDQVCTNKTWGINCRNPCNCNMTNIINCNSNDGQCNCKPGFTGPQCNQRCPNGTFGDNCQGKCNCLETATCDSRTGNCICKAGWSGPRCNIPCTPGQYGINCTQKCHCYHGSCSPEDGTCNCDPGYMLPFCAETCDPGTYGPSCLFFCDCNYQDCNYQTGVCQCGPGLIGDKCQKNCPHGKYGQSCAKTCSCQQNAGCDGATGLCQCPPGYVGSDCGTKCTQWKYGQDCLQTCSCVQANTASCDFDLGRCHCKPGFRGRNCSLPCSSGYYGPGCKQTCACSGGSPCDPVSGQCQCIPGLIGATCNQACPAGKYGAGCKLTCPTCSAGVCSKADGTCICQSGTCTCPKGLWKPQCSSPCNCVHGGCDSQTGACVCDAGWTGTMCQTQCTQGTYGANCGSPCKCVNSMCDPTDGSCNCSDGFTGPTCAMSCANGTFGPNCQLPCPSCGSRSYGCDPVTGICQCSTGYAGLSCDQPCPQGKYGDQCSKTCNCVNGVCDTVTGNCTCNPGYTGTACDQACPDGTWGGNCINSCNCGPHSTRCDQNMGFCICNPGFQGVKCRQSCDSGYYGANCSLTCSCAAGKSRCSPLDGSCECTAGYQGTTCSQPCPVGKWGNGCTQDCECSNRGNCSITTGVCDCAPGYTGATCVQPCKQDVFWGKNCANQCNCNGHHCDHVTGSCDCPAGKTGANCQQDCDGNHFGLQCAQTCQCKNSAACDPVTGTCHCPQGWSGDNCNQKCPRGRYGDGCTMTCNCMNGASCDRTGVCQCAAGYKGTNCSQSCARGTWGDGCRQKCSSLCAASCLADTGVCRCQMWTCQNGGTCGKDGRCNCVLGWMGDNCMTGQGQNLRSSQNKFDFSLSLGQVIGIVIAFLILLVAAVIGMGFFMRRRTLKNAPTSPVKYKDNEVKVLSQDDDGGFSNPNFHDQPEEDVMTSHLEIDHVDSEA